ncbi:MAG: hypothetical protein NVSMB56_16790 [Pyrinomonadaceae bacterium]
MRYEDRDSEFMLKSFRQVILRSVCYEEIICLKLSHPVEALASAHNLFFKE